ncbi:RNA polymerase sigma factor [Sphingosinicella sp. BN140058]|uniref:RNA polymerase sigma factor n=1 Tax=Sphingosinicella sp. BN140058 TaxID=1892855 RepID=UPI001012B659|nr:RNA polymerase sigma factor [Sphingosinicella sp. BN140058]QAY78212.1 RNA polymerase sigma factor [Sphingosinicella sp. BN140058]
MAEPVPNRAEWLKEHIGILQRVSRAFAQPADQHDLLQELMIAVWKAAPVFRGDSAAATFFYRVAHNRALTWRRQDGRRRSRAAEAERGALDQAAADPTEAMLLERLYAAIRKLPPIDRSLVLLSLEGVTYADIAALHQMTIGNVGARLSRARTRIAALVEEDQDGF